MQITLRQTFFVLCFAAVVAASMARPSFVWIQLSFWIALAFVLLMALLATCGQVDLHPFAVGAVLFAATYFTLVLLLESHDKKLPMTLIFGLFAPYGPGEEIVNEDLFTDWSYRRSIAHWLFVPPFGLVGGLLACKVKRHATNAEQQTSGREC